MRLDSQSDLVWQIIQDIRLTKLTIQQIAQSYSVTEYYVNAIAATFHSHTLK